MNKLKICSALALLVIQFISCNSSESDTSKKEDAGQTQGLKVASLDEANQAVPNEISDYVLESYILTMAQIELSKTALDRSKDPKLKDMASAMLEKYNALYDRMNVLAEQKNITLPLVMDKRRQKPVQKLRDKTEDAKFDHEWLDQVEENLEEQIELNKGSASINDPDLRALIGDSSVWMDRMMQQVRSAG